jgi:peptidyl-prolyl cis-trans isomerase A (cyclophilin A)
MKYLSLWITLCAPVSAELVAHVKTTNGNINVALQFDKAPQAVANFITLAQSTRRHVSPLTGAVTDSPFYIGEKFFRVIDTTGFKIAQTGSGTGTNSGGPGYAFRDEFDPSLTHTPYVLSMANSGINTNGSQIFFTGNGSYPHLDNVHTIFGIITDVPSRAVIDTILAAGNDATTITGVTFSRTDPAAVAFDEHAQNLPTCSALPGQLSVNLGSETAYTVVNPMPPGSVFHASRSTNLISWTKEKEIYQGADQAGISTRINLDTASLPRAFYNIATVTSPGALAPVSMSNRTVVFGLFGNQTFTCVFDATGVMGEARYVSGNPTVITPITDSSYVGSAYGGTWIIQTTQFNPLRFRVGLNSISGNLTIGTNKSEQFNGFSWAALSSGSLSLSR